MAAAAETDCPSSWAEETVIRKLHLSFLIPHWNSSTRASNRDMWMLLHWQDNSKWNWYKKDTILNWRSREQDLPTGIKYKKWDFNECPFNKYPQWSMAFLVAQMVKNLPAMQQTWVWSLGQEDSLEKGMLPTPVLLPGEFHGQRSLARYSLWGCKESEYTWATNILHTKYGLYRSPKA